MRHAHRIAATWLFVRFWPEPNRAVLLGDLVEEFGTGRSSVWLWRQVLAAVAMSCTNEMREHGQHVTGAVAIGIGLLLLFQYAATSIVFGTSHLMPADAATLLNVSVLMGMRSFVAAAATGWIVANLDRRRGPVTVVTLVGCYLVVTIPWVSFFSTTLGDQSLTHLTVQGSAIMTTGIGLLVGGMWSRPEPLRTS
jgi:hypothetical protein